MYAYQNESIWFTVEGEGDGMALNQLSFDVFDERGLRDSTEAPIGASFDTGSNQLRTFAKGRGLGDCGNEGHYTWEDGSFKLLQWRQKPNCDGKYRDEWPISYSKR